MRRLEGRTAVVTGAAAGLGKAIALRFSAEGAHVIACDIRSSVETGVDSAPSTVEIIRSQGGRSTPLIADVTQRSDVDRMLAIAREPTGRVDVLINNAGKFGGASLLNTSDEEWNFYLTLNLSSVFVMCRTFVAAMLEQDAIDDVRGHIVNMGSQLGITAPQGAAAYAAAKAGVIHLTRQIAVDYARSGIIANAIAPGRIITGDHPGEREYLTLGTIDEATQFSLSRTPFPRLGEPSDVARAALFLACGDSTFVSGAVLSVDGGWTAY
jgi:NAD(P)-dependent dehydrogenase (short-subunit alcohol dehydrogenase family)